MPKDLFTLKKTASLYKELLINGKVNKIIMPSSDELVLTLYNKKAFNVVISTKANYSRVSLTTQNYQSPITAPNYCMLLRKYLQGSTIINYTVSSLDRIIEIEFSKENDFKEFKNYSLYVEIMGKYSNVFLTSNDLLLGALKTSPQTLEKGRITLAGAKYLFPFKQDKFDPYVYSDVVTAFKNATYPITANFILNNFLGFAPVSCEEIAYLINESLTPNTFTPENAYNVLNGFLNKGLNPVIITSDSYSDVFTFDYKHLDGERRFFNSYLEAEEYFFTQKETSQKIGAYKTALLSKITAFKKKEEKKLALLNDRILSSENLDKFKLYGELILSNIYKIKKGDVFIETENYYDNNNLVKIPLDKELTPEINAQKYYKKYSKCKSTLLNAKGQKEQTLNEINYANSLIYQVNSLDNISDLKEIEEELLNQGFIKNTANKNVKNGKKKGGKKEYIFKTFNHLGYVIKIGKNNLQNEALLDQASRLDLWLHVKDYHSSHAIIKTNGENVPDKVIEAAAEIVAYYSEARNGSKIAVDITLRKFVKTPPNSRPGSVFYTDYKTYFVNPNSHTELETN